MAPQDRLAQVNAHLNYPQGLFAGQTAIITGAGQGIGAEAARLFANEGAKVVVADIDESEIPHLGNLFPCADILSRKSERRRQRHQQRLSRTRHRRAGRRH